MEKHFTVSVYIISQIRGAKKLLLHRHKKLNMWLPVGGHIEFGETPIDTAIREAKEESGLDIEIVNPEKLFESNTVKQLVTPIALMEQTIAADKDNGLHKHLDSVFIAFTDYPEKAKMEEEFGWFSKEELTRMDIKDDVRILADKVFSIVKVLIPSSKSNY